MKLNTKEKKKRSSKSQRTGGKKGNYDVKVQESRMNNCWKFQQLHPACCIYATLRSVYYSES